MVSFDMVGPDILVDIHNFVVFREICNQPYFSQCEAHDISNKRTEEICEKLQSFSVVS